MNEIEKKKIVVWNVPKTKTGIVLKEDNPTCGLCSQNIREACLYYDGWSKTDNQELLICQDCINDNWQRKILKRPVEILRIIVIAQKNELPFGSNRMIRSPPILTPSRSDYTVFDGEKIHSESTTDNTLHAGRDSIRGATIGDLQAIADGKDVPLLSSRSLQKLIDETGEHNAKRLEILQMEKLRELEEDFERRVNANPQLSGSIQDSKRLVEQNKNRRVDLL